MLANFVRFMFIGGMIILSVIGLVKIHKEDVEAQLQPPNVIHIDGDCNARDVTEIQPNNP